MAVLKSNMGQGAFKPLRDLVCDESCMSLWSNCGETLNFISSEASSLRQVYSAVITTPKSVYIHISINLNKLSSLYVINILTDLFHLPVTSEDH